MNEPAQPQRAPALLVVSGVFAFILAVALFFSENGKAIGDPNYAPALLAAGAGAFLVLCGVILLTGRRR